MKVFVGMETSGMFRARFVALGHDTISCDLLPAEDRPATGRHIIGDVFETLDALWARGWWPDLALFHPTCTNLTISAEWAYKDPDFERYPGVGYHQRLKPGTLFGTARRRARERDLNGVRRIFALPIRRKVVENPIGVIGSRIRRPSQIVQPYEFGDDASKATCFWFVGKDGEPLPEMALPRDPTRYIPPSLRPNGRRYWANQTDTGQNRLSLLASTAGKTVVEPIRGSLMQPSLTGLVCLF